MATITGTDGDDREPFIAHLLARPPACWAPGSLRKRVRQRRALLRLPDAMLRDIGISRRDAWRGARKLFRQA